MQLGSLVKSLNGSYRVARYLLEGGLADRWVGRGVGSGHHRDFSLGEGFALALLIKLAQAGLTTGKARRVAELVEEAITGIAHQMNWDALFFPFRGEFTTKFDWLVDVGDLQFFRITTNSNPSGGRKLKSFNWITLDRRRREAPDARPSVIVRVDLTRIASLVERAYDADRPD